MSQLNLFLFLGTQSPLAAGCAGFSGRVLSPHSPLSPAWVSAQPCGRLAPCAGANQPLLWVLSQSDPPTDSHMQRNVLGTPRRPVSVGTTLFPTVVPVGTPPTPATLHAWATSLMRTMLVELSQTQAKKKRCLGPALTSALPSAGLGCFVKFLNFPGSMLFVASSLTE